LAKSWTILFLNISGVVFFGAKKGGLRQRRIGRPREIGLAPSKALVT
jgi:hypothetical protein